MKTIHKQTIDIIDEQILSLKCIKILHFAEQNGKLCVWYETDDILDIEMTIRLCIYGTGNPMNQDNDYFHEYITTVKIGGLVWHLYYKYL